VNSSLPIVKTTTLDNMFLDKYAGFSRQKKYFSLEK